MNTTRLQARLLATLSANTVRVSLSFGISLIIARHLGPSEYGNFNFLLASFTAIANLIDMASASAFYTFISQQKRGRRFFQYYSFWILIQFASILLLALFLPPTFRAKIWLGHPRYLVILALFSSFTVNQIWRFAGQIGESIRDTIGVQIRNVALAVVHLMGVLLLVQLDWITIPALFILNTILYFSFAVGYGIQLYHRAPFFDDREEHLKPILTEFKVYCLPLVLYIITGFFYAFADNWLLQKFGGAVQQGYYSVGAKFASVSGIAATSIVMIFWKEVAEAFNAGNMERVRYLFHRIYYGLHFVSALIACLLIPFSREILQLVVGPSYQSATLPLAVMFLYCIHQSVNHVPATMLYALGKTKIKSIIGVAFVTTSLLISCVLLAPKNNLLPGFNLGAFGLALKMLVCQLLEVNLSLFFVSRYIKARYDWLYQIHVLILLLPIGFVSKLCAKWTVRSLVPFRHSLFVITISGVLYLVATSFLLYALPALAGLNREQMNVGLARIYKWMMAKMRNK
jgi:O-antigen/teichoic acid export membrane protein